ncbi:16S rRNA (guanine(527)-N(7))-methyltransferase RsmG [Suttonella ornithocola]|uniref:Ribosomal RNA small subunit methyltransferase G n=1 Tax=Suttonella ornithocola TaxID=279832 RepID=A0A380MUX2_9GAMM|nr:16S rRNA (guanine(527)-N(7))-methyltransferase RsmG [Suttonella ornithocola]SUO95994.1 Ribosomal RNA small subunit methyltransferase G [Suttonella ornithocola]
MHSKTVSAYLEEGLKQLTFNLPLNGQEKLMTYLALLNKWNKVHNLSAIREEKEQIRIHLLDCLAVVPFVKDKDTLADIGTGAGLPGLILSIVFPDKKIYLVESNRKKVAFLREVKRVLDLEKVEIVSARVESWQPPKPLPIILSRAVAKIDTFLKLTEHLGAEDARWALMKAHNDEVCTYPGFVISRIESVEVPLLEAPRLWIEISREGKLS